MWQKSYSWESVIDISEDIEWEISKMVNGVGEFPGKITITVEYTKED